MNALVKELKDAVQDWEWYPSTSEMMTCVKNHLESDTDSQYIIMDLVKGQLKSLIAPDVNTLSKNQ